MENSELEKDAADKIAKDAFGIDYLFPWQKLVIQNIIDAANATPAEIAAPENDADSYIFGRQIVLLPTGSGKSFCFLIPALMLEGATLIIYPLLSLMSDQARRIAEANVESVVIRGNQSEEERNAIFEKIKNGVKIIIANPEVLQSERVLEKLCECNISHIAIDEAHCISEWGESFRPSYLELPKIIEKINAPLVSAFTATAGEVVLSKINSLVFQGCARIVRSEADRPNIRYYVVNTLEKTQSALSLSLDEEKPMLFFCGTRTASEDMARELNFFHGKNIARFYHAGMEKSEKEKIEKWFYESDDGILCATCAYGMGVDKKNIRTVVHIAVPETVEEYLQESGRSGRDGKVSKAYMLWSPQDEKLFARFEKNNRAHILYDFANATTCRRDVLLDALGAEKAVCSGCDLCDAKNNANEKIATKQSIENLYEKKAMRFISRNQNMFTKAELAEELIPILNDVAKNEIGKLTWESESTSEFVFNLLCKGALFEKQFPWRKKITVKKNINFLF